MALAFVRNTLKLSASVAQRGLTTTNLPATSKLVLDSTSKDGQTLRVPPLHGMCYSTSQSESIRDLNIADILYGVHCKHLFLIDIREPEELSKTGKIGRALNIPAGEIEKAFSLSYGDFEAKYHVPKPNFLSERVVIYGKSADMSKEACEKLRKMGYDKIKSYSGGITEWNNLILGDLKSLQEHYSASSRVDTDLAY